MDISNLDKPDEFGFSPLDYLSTADQISDEFTEALQRRSDQSAWSALKQYGMPQGPSDVATLTYMAMMAGVIFAVRNGFVELTDKGRKSESGEKLSNPKDGDNVVPFDQNIEL